MDDGVLVILRRASLPGDVADQRFMWLTIFVAKDSAQKLSLVRNYQPLADGALNTQRSTNENSYHN
ncbi:hypothetical protein GRAQ_03913 [Rahnella aquatilis CIP 78.65 = ATCC 33071]|uniref:Uncharacterized protein n=1 Tax=Rahnella aquatilis (strain ATCC 33071 / DSM 4594 / JCM 1683 / NBRC 105701 / NCIMB 13365 / CIP 78.65) TaxID=745277 RepID=H2IQF1_RAHAC|nr:hypothetical protein Rahaq2_0264 [Rahnella aquatilis CIP 78.65 = ATCC 33071]KFD01067.1 hypothetical protein GRAQ_03913 [Rahnella aquatilis CIP 78.65 = ATCC 33071]